MQSYNQSDLDILFARLSARRWWIVAVTIVSIAAFTAFAFLTTPVYRASTVLISASEERNSVSNSLGSAIGQIGGLASLAGLSLSSSDAATEEALAVLRSRQFTERFIDENNLMLELFADRWDADKKAWRPDAIVPTHGRAFRKFDGIRTIKQDKKTSLTTIQIDWRDRVKASAWANDLALRLNAEMRQRAIAKSEASLKFLEAELANTAVVETRQAINRLIEAQVRHRMLANVTSEYAFRVVDAAMPADADDPLRPKKAVLVILGPIVGVILGMIAALAAGWISDERGRKASNAD